MNEHTDEEKHTLIQEIGARYVVDSKRRPVAVLLTLEEYDHYLDLLDDEEDSQNPEIATRLSEAAEGTSGERRSLDDYLDQRQTADAKIQD